MLSVLLETSYLAANGEENQSILCKRTSTNNPPADGKCKSNTEINIYCSIKKKPGDYILHATVIEKIQIKFGQYIPCRVLLDRSSQSHFITDRFAQHLILSRSYKNASIQDLSTVNTEADHSVSLHLRSRHRDWHTTFNCVILSHINITTTATLKKYT